MSEKLDLDGIKKYWMEQARKHGQSPSASWSDIHLIEMEVREVIAHISDRARVLDIGCAGGYSTLQYAVARDIFIRGLDYVPDMVAQAKMRLAGLEGRLESTVEFDVGDITALNEPEGEYDRVVVSRVLINLDSVEAQLEALSECARVLRPGGMLLMTEATLQGWRKMNAFRQEWELQEIPSPSFNRYLDQDMIVSGAPKGLVLVEIKDFSSTYYVATRVLKPLLIKALGVDVDVADPDTHFNRFFSKLPAVGDYGTQKLFVFKKAV